MYMPNVTHTNKISEPNHEAGLPELEAIFAGNRAHRHAGPCAEDQRVRNQPVNNEPSKSVERTGQRDLPDGRLDYVCLRGERRRRRQRGVRGVSGYLRVMRIYLPSTPINEGN